MYWDLGPPHNGDTLHDDTAKGVPRPNHALAHSIRKAMLVPAVANAFGHEFGESQTVALQIAMIFESVGRKSEVGFGDAPDVYMGYKHASLDACSDYMTTNAATMNPPIEADAWRLGLEAMRKMYYPSVSAITPLKQVLEVSHELDLLRCYGQVKMAQKLHALRGQVVARLR